MQRQKVLVAALAAALAVMPASAQWRTTTGGAQGPNGAANGPAVDQGPDRPGDRQGDAGVARMSVADGDVQLLRGETGDRMQARGGMPLMGNDSVITGRSSRAEVQLGPGNLIRLSEDTRVRIVDVGNRYFRVEVLNGEINISQLKGGEADIDVMTANTTVRPRLTFVSVVLTASSVAGSRAEVGSSRINSPGFRTSARAMATRCFWPPESLPPRSPARVW